jgi:hypothetical protein
MALSPLSSILLLLVGVVEAVVMVAVAVRVACYLLLDML